MLALDLDTAVTLRLFYFDNEREVFNQKNMAIRIANAVAKGMGMLSDEENDEVLGSEFISNDPYADENTQIM